MPLIEHILQDLPADQRQLCFQFDQLEDGYTAEATLTLPSGKVCARTDTPLADYKAAVDQVVDKLAGQLCQHQQRIRLQQVAAGQIAGSLKQL